MSPESNPAERSVRDAFLARYLEDLERGRVRGCAEYQALFPGHEAEVAQEFALVDDEGDRTAPVAAPAAVGPREFGHYRVHEEVGRGGQAVVYRASDARLGREVALKILRAGALHLAGSDDLRRFQREAAVSARLDHPGICSVYDAGEIESVPYIAMQFVRGETLAHRVAVARERGAGSVSLDGALDGSGASTGGGRAGLDALLGFFEQAARALHFAHEQGLVHRDVKPGNLMVGADGGPVVLDFGLARVEADEHSLTGSGAVLGTPYYMSPEQVRGDVGRVDRRADVYGLGVALYEALTLRRPFEAVSRDALYRDILTREPVSVQVLNPRVPRDLRVVVETAMAKERGQRYESALTFAEDLRRVRAREPIVARPAGPAVRAWRWAQRRPAVASLLALLLIVTAVAAVGLGSSYRALAVKVAELTRLSDLQYVKQLDAQAIALRAFLPEHLAALETWRESSQALLGRKPLHVATRERLRAAAPLSPEDEWQLTNLTSLCSYYMDFETRSYPAGVRRLEALRGAEQRTLVAAAAAWRAATARVRTRYGGLELQPQLGLVPLGPDPASGLEEFAHVASGRVPERDGQGHLVLTPDVALVFVLIPAGTFTMGSTPPADGGGPGPNVDPYGPPHERPPHAVTLDAFLLSKYEMTEQQWYMLTGRRPDTGAHAADFVELRPVWTVARIQAWRVLSVNGLDLPTEAQWEYAARAGTATVWWTGDDYLTLQGAGNVADAAFLRRYAAENAEARPEYRLDDGYPAAAPIGAFAANAFGLHDTIGNVAEHVRDQFLPYDRPLRPGDGLRERGPDDAPGTDYVIRGGAWNTVLESRSAHRFPYGVDAALDWVGMRPACPIRGGG